MELGMAGYIAEAATGAAAIVIDCLPGMTAEQVTARTQPLVSAKGGGGGGGEGRVEGGVALVSACLCVNAGESYSR